MQEPKNRSVHLTGKLAQGRAKVNVCGCVCAGKDGVGAYVELACESVYHGTVV